VVLTVEEAMIFREELKNFVSCSCCCCAASNSIAMENPINGETAFWFFLLKPFPKRERRSRL